MNKKITKQTVLFVLSTAMLCAGGCQPIVTRTIDPARPDFDPSITSGIKENVVIMPLADYSSGTTPDKATRRQAKIMAALSHQLSGSGLMPAIQEDVNAFLFAEHIIAPAQEGISQLDAEKWGSYVNSVTDAIMAGDNGNQTPATVGVSPQVIQELGNRFQAKYLLRGRIVEYRIGQDRTFNPLRRGILPFVVDGTSTTLFGIAKSEQYDTWQEMATAGTAGALIGTNAGTPFNGNPSAHGSNALVWGAVGAGVAYLANQGGDVPEARIQLELALQSTSNGQVLWANRTEFTVTPGNAFDRYDQQHLLALAMEEAAASLVQDMRRHVYGVPDAAASSMKSATPVVSTPVAVPGQKQGAYPPMVQK
ncbi:MAG: hypothetical protein ABIJ50_09710 [Pseudomonadota bacterium]